MRCVTIAIVGAGNRGSAYSQFAREQPDRMRVVAVAEPIAVRRQRLATEHAIPPENVFGDWRALAERERLADAVIIATPDALHVEPGVALAERGYHMLLEKPMAPDEAGCRRVVNAVRGAGVLFGVCHVLRYTAYTRRLKEMLNAGVVGDIVSVQHLEPVGYWHQAHSFVRGNWRNSTESSPMLLAKSCHDLDWLRHVMGVPCERVSSFGALHHFRREQRPAGAADRCLDCPVEPACAYSAKKLYLRLAESGHTGWPVGVITADPSVEGVTRALREGPYGRCVYACDNDVVDHQVVSLQFAGGRTAVFTMTAFNRGGDRKTRIFGTRGEIRGDGRVLEHFDFLTDRTETFDTQVPEGTILGGHGGGDYGLMDAFIAAVAENDPSRILSGVEETFESHRMVFAAEEARLHGTVVAV